MKGDYSRSVSMQCSTCGGTDFEFKDGSSPARCVGCDRVYSGDELIRENGGRIESEFEDMKVQFVADIRKDLSKMFKKLK